MAQVKVSELPVLSGVPDGNDLLYIVDSGTSKQIMVSDLFQYQHRYPCDGRLTLTSGVPVLETRTVSSTLYFTPYNGNEISLYDGTRWKLYKFSEVSKSVSGYSSSILDVFIYDNAGTLTLHFQPWASDNARNIDLTTLNGVRILSSDYTKRYLGTVGVHSDGTIIMDVSVSGSGPRYMYVWNYYNREPLSVSVYYSGGVYTYTTATARRAANSHATSVFFISGLSTHLYISIVHKSWGSTIGVWRVAYIGLNGSPLYLNYGNTASGTDVYSHSIAAYPKCLGGINNTSVYEFSNAGGTSTWHEPGLQFLMYM